MFMHYFLIEYEVFHSHAECVSFKLSLIIMASMPSTHRSIQRSEIRMNEFLNQDTSSEEDKRSELEDIVMELLPAYYKYHEHLVALLEQEGHANMLDYEERIPQGSQKFKQLKEYAESRKGRRNSKRKDRLLLTEKIVEKHRKSQAEQRELMLKYERKEIREIIGGMAENVEQSNLSQLRSFEQPNKFQKIVLEPGQEHRLSFKKQDSQKRENQEIIIHGGLKDEDAIMYLDNSSATNKDKRTNKFDYESESIENRLQSRAKTFESYVGSNPSIKSKNKKVRISNVRQNILDAEDEGAGEGEGADEGVNEGEQNGDMSLDIKNKRNASEHDVYLRKKNVSRIRIEDDDFSHPDKDKEQIKINAQKPTHNMVNIEHDETYSEKDRRTFTRHNTPNFQTMSHRPTPSSYFELQREKIEEQRRLAEELHRKVSEVLGEADIPNESEVFSKRSIVNEVIDLNMEDSIKEFEIYSGKKNSGVKSSQARNSQIKKQKMKGVEMKDSFERNEKQKWAEKIEEEQSKEVTAVSFILEELCELWSIVEYYKYLLKNKQYSILKKLCSDEIGTGPIALKLLEEGLQRIVSGEEKYKVKRAISRVFGGERQISFEDFGESLKSKLSETEARYITVKVSPINPHEIVESLSRFFLAIMEIIYFEDKIKGCSHSEDLVGRISQNHNDLSLDKLEEFIYGTTKNRINKLKVSLLLKNTLKTQKVTAFLHWMKDREVRERILF